MARRKGTVSWTQTEIIKEIRRVMDVMGVDYMPRRTDFDAHSSVMNPIQKNGGLTKYADLMGIPMAPARRPGTYVKRKKEGGHNDRIEKWNGRPSRAAEIEAKARKQGLSYADLQKAETLRLAGRISV